MHGKDGLYETNNVKPNPSASKNTLPARRKLFCAFYNSCLDVAVRSRWSGFSCEECDSFERIEWNAEDRREDEFHCMALLLIVFSGQRHVHLNPGGLVESLERATRCHQEFGGMFIH